MLTKKIFTLVTISGRLPPTRHNKSGNLGLSTPMGRLNKDSSERGPRIEIGKRRPKDIVISDEEPELSLLL